MDYYYRMTEYSKGVYTYAYSRKTMALDGSVSYDTETGDVKLKKLCTLDKDIPGAGERAEDIFYTLVSEGMPTELHIDLT